MEKEEYIFGPITPEDIKNVKETTKLTSLEFIELTLDDDKLFEGLFRRPGNDTISRFTTKQQEILRGGKGDIVGNNMRFCLDNCLLPDKSQLSELSKTYPLIGTSLIGELISGQGLATDSKKKQV